MNYECYMLYTVAVLLLLKLRLQHTAKLINSIHHFGTIVLKITQSSTEKGILLPHKEGFVRDGV